MPFVDQFCFLVPTFAPVYHKIWHLPYSHQISVSTPLLQQGRAGRCVGKIFYGYHTCVESPFSPPWLALTLFIFQAGKSVGAARQSDKGGNSLTKVFLINLLILFLKNHCAFVP